jgi:hypothetical protein
MKKLQVKVIETLIVEKTVEVEVCDDASQNAIEIIAQNVAFQKLAVDPNSGWELTGSEGVTCEIEGGGIEDEVLG